MKKVYHEYRKLDPKIKKNRIQDAQQSQKHRKPNPQGSHEFQQYSFIDFEVLEDNKKIKLQTYRYNAKEKTIGVVFMFHGLNSHLGHGAHLAHYFSLHGLTTVGFDHRGFGRSEGHGGYVDGIESHIFDTKKFLSIVLPLYRNTPKFALGLSMGGMTAYKLTLNDPKLFDGTILMAPALKNNIGGGLVLATKILGTILPDKMKLSKPIYGRASKNPAITQFVKQDKYAFSQRMSLKTVQMLVTTMDTSPETFSQYSCPFMIIQGGLDKLVNPEVAFELYDKSKTKEEDKQILFYQGMWHDIWHEEQIYDILPKIVAWIEKRIIKINSEKYEIQKIVEKQDHSKLKQEQK